MISVYKDGDGFVWIPVAKENAGNDARAFLPFMGLSGKYLYGYKAQIERGAYFTALSAIQDAAINNTSEEFKVASGTERQYKAKWRHGRQQDVPLLGPTKGWVKIPIDRLTQCTDSELAFALEKSGTRFADLSETIAPVLCNDETELLGQAAILRSTIRACVPVGQSSPAKTSGVRETFVRDASVVAYVLAQARGACECCKSPAPFQRDDGQPYLEVHHVRHLANGGSDTIENAVAVCPNCHRELHCGSAKLNLVERLFANVKRLVRE